MTLFAYWLNDTYVGATVYLDGVKGSDSNGRACRRRPGPHVCCGCGSHLSEGHRFGVIWVTHTVTVLDEQTWDLKKGRDCIVKALRPARAT